MRDNLIAPHTHVCICACVQFQLGKLKAEFDKICAKTPQDIRDHVWISILAYDVEEFLRLNDSFMEQRLVEWLQNTQHKYTSKDEDAIISFFSFRRHYPLRSPAGLQELQWHEKK